MAMTPEQITADNYDANARQVAPAYEFALFYSVSVRGDWLHCGKCGWKRIYASDSVRNADKIAHATPVRNPDSLDIVCPFASWGGAMATAALHN